MADDTTRTVRPFSSFLVEYDRGRLHDEVSAELNRLAERVSDLQKPGKLVVTIEIKPFGKEATDTMIVSASAKSTLPEAGKPQALYFVDQEFNLTRRNPRQDDLPGIRPVDREEAR